MSNIYNMTDTWTGGTAYTAIQMNVTDTSSTAGSLLADLQVGGTSKFVVSKLGTALVGDGGASPATGVPGFAFIGATGVGFRRNSTTGIVFTASGADIWNAAASAINMRSNGLYGWSGTTDPTQAMDTQFARVSAGVVKVSNGSNVAGAIVTAPTTVASLPAAAAGNQGARAFVTDASATMTAGVGTAVVGGGANKVPVYSDGTSWLIG